MVTGESVVRREPWPQITLHCHSVFQGEKAGKILTNGYCHALGFWLVIPHRGVTLSALWPGISLSEPLAWHSKADVVQHPYLVGEQIQGFPVKLKFTPLCWSCRPMSLASHRPLAFSEASGWAWEWPIQVLWTARISSGNVPTSAPRPSAAAFTA